MPIARIPGAPERVLVIQTAFLGDAVLTVPLIRELGSALPHAQLSVLTTESGHGLLGAMPEVEDCLVLDKGWDRQGGLSCRRLIGALRENRFDAVVAAHRSFRSGLIARLSGAALRVGFAGAPGAWAYTDRVRWQPERHAARRYLDLLEPFGIDPDAADASPRLAVRPAEREAIDRLLAARGIPSRGELLCIAPGSVWATKRWLPEGFVRIVAAAEERGLIPLLIGGEGDRALCREIAALSGRAVAVLAGATTIPELLALVERARMVVANDSGAAHVAAAVGTPVVSIFGSTVPEMGYTASGPGSRVVEHPGLSCRPCGRHGSKRCPLGHFRCMRELEPSRVLAAVDALLETTRTLPRPTVVAGGAAWSEGAGPELQRVVPG